MRSSLKIAALGVALVASVLLGCATHLLAADVEAVQQSANLNAAAYERLRAADAGASTALERAAYCADWGIAQRNKIVLLDAGISCAP